MKAEINKLIEKIENDSVGSYAYEEVLNMLRDLLVKDPVTNFYCWDEDCFLGERRCLKQCIDCSFFTGN